MAGTDARDRENLREISDALAQLGYSDAGDSILAALHSPGDNPLSVIRLALQETVSTKAEAVYKSKFGRSKLDAPVFLSDLYTYKVRQLDLEYIQQLSELAFVRDRMNLIIWGSPGTGKTWMAKALATKACQKGFSTRWVTYPFLCRELMRLRTEDSKRYEARLKYYSKFQVLCIDEFPNAEIEDKFIMQEFFNIRALSGNSTIVSGQCEPRNWDALFEVKSFAQSIRGRLLEHAHQLEMKGPDLRLYDPNRE